MSLGIRGVLLLSLFLLAHPLAAEDAFYVIPLSELKLTSGELPSKVTTDQRRSYLTVDESLSPRVVLDGSGEGYLTYEVHWEPDVRPFLVARGPAGVELSGVAIMPNDDNSAFVKVKFVVPPGKTAPENRSRFFGEKAKYFGNLMNRDVAGAAWFRRQARLALLECETDVRPTLRDSFRPNFNREDSFDLFTGGRAISENLQLDRDLAMQDQPPARAPAGEALAAVPTTTPAQPTKPANAIKSDDKPAPPKMMPLRQIEGITVAEIDWSKYLAGRDPQLDVLARLVPADQHVMFFPTFQAAVQFSDELARQDVPVLYSFSPRAENAGIVDRYQKQLCLSLTGVGRLLGPQLAQSMAITGSDPYFITGTDVAVLFESKQADVLSNLLWTQISLVAKQRSATELSSGKVAAVEYRGARSADRAVSSYVAKIKGAVVVTNSLAQLERLAAVAQDKTAALASLPEFTFFRERYPLGDADETALLFLSDATIRRWCGPRWRISSSRRTRAAAVLADLQAQWMGDAAAQKNLGRQLTTDLQTLGLGTLTLTAQGVSASELGSLDFLTPIVETPLTEVTEAEAVLYQRWRDGYQSNWRWAFDPIALRFSVQANRVAADLTIMPLITGSDYNEFVSVSRGVKLDSRAGDPHNSLLHFVMSINKDSPTMKQLDTLSEEVLPLKINPLSWFGKSIGIYLDESDYWQKLAALKTDEEREKFLETGYLGLPIGLRLGVSSPIKLAGFLTAIRTLVETTAPGLVTWDLLKHEEQSYVQISSTPASREEFGGDIKIYYLTTPEALLVSLNEDVIKSAISRRKGAAPDSKPVDPAVASASGWLGENVALHLNQRWAAGVADGFLSPHYQKLAQQRSWGNLPILNAFKKAYPDQDPPSLYTRYWQTTLECPGGGKYVWNAEWQTYESTVYGHPAQPKTEGARPLRIFDYQTMDFGLTFEEQGLRARVRFDR